MSNTNTPQPVPLIETDTDDRISSTNDKPIVNNKSWVDYLQCFPDNDKGIPPGCWWSCCPLNPDNWLMNRSPLATKIAHFGLNYFDENRKFYLGIASLITICTFFIVLWGCLSLSTKRNIVRRTYWYGGTGHNITDNSDFSIYIGLRSVEEVSCKFTPGYEEYQSSCEIHSIRWESPECHQGLTASACASCSAVATGMWFTVFTNCFSLILAWLGAQTRMRSIADCPAQKLVGMFSDTFGVVSLGFALLHFRYQCLLPLRAAYNVNNQISTVFWSGPGFVCYVVCCLSGIIRSVAHWLTPVPGEGHRFFRQLFYPKDALPLWTWPNNELLKKRFYSTFLFAPKFFLAAFMWEGFGLIATSSGYSSTSASYYFLTGTGTFIGIVLSAAVIIAITKQHASNEEYETEFHNTFVVAFAAGLTAGTLWQVSVNISIERGFNFSGAFFFMVLTNSMSYFVSALCLRWINGKLPLKYKLRVLPITSPIVWQELSLALAVGVADAFFVGTDNRMLRYGWLTAFRVSNSTPVVSAMVLSGLSAMSGYLVAQSLQNVMFADGVLWLDENTEAQGYAPHPSNIEQTNIDTLPENELEMSTVNVLHDTA